MRSAKPRLSWLVVLLATAGFGVTTFAQTDDPLLASMQKAGGAKVAMGSVPPWIYVSPNGEAKGYYVEVIKLALKGMGVSTLTPDLIAWDGLIPALLARQDDLVAPGLRVSEARCKTVLYSAPLALVQSALYIVRGNPKHLTSYAQLGHRADIKLAVIRGSIQEEYAAKVGIGPEQLVRVPDIQACVATVTNGRADACALAENTIPDPEQKGVEQVLDKAAPVAAFAVVFRKDDIRFRDAFNKQLEVSRSNGTWKDIFVKYGGTNWDVLSKARKASDVEPSCE